MRIKAFIAGCSGTRLTVQEAVFFKKHNPWGFILFARNIETPEQAAALTQDLRACGGRENAPILIDQEGGRVQRLRPPHWPNYPSGSRIGAIYRRDAEAGKRAAWLQSRLIAHDIRGIGANVDCLPVLDVPAAGSHSVIGDRAYSIHPHEVAQIARSACEGLLAGGVLPVIKHIPGHGRAKADSHLALPRVDTHPAILGCTDFYPFMQLADMPLAMTAHVVYSGFDEARPATTSPEVIGKAIRGWMGFDGVLMSDDLSMKALSGDFAERTRSAFAAGCDIVLHCNGEMEEMAAVADATPELAGRAAERVRLAEAMIGKPAAMDEAALRAEFSALTETEPATAGG